MQVVFCKSCFVYVLSEFFPDSAPSYVHQESQFLAQLEEQISRPLLMPLNLDPWRQKSNWSLQTKKMLTFLKEQDSTKFLLCLLAPRTRPERTSMPWFLVCVK